MHAGTGGTRLLLDHYRAAVGPGPVPHARAHLAYVADTTRQACDALRATMPRWLAAAAASTRIDGTPGPARDPGRYLQQLMAEGAGDPAAAVENITRLGTEVIPLLRC